MFRDFGSAPAGSRIRRRATEDEKGCRNCRSGRRHGPIRRASGPSPGLECRVSRAEIAAPGAFGSSHRQIALIGTIRGVRHVIPDPIQPHRRAFSQNAPLGSARGLRMGVFFAGRKVVAASVSPSSRTPTTGSASWAGFGLIRMRRDRRSPKRKRGAVESWAAIRWNDTRRP
jgi:hypothetical protein